MRVKIEKSDKDTFWYSNKIGQEFNVIDWYGAPDWYRCTFDAKGILKSDCSIVSPPSEAIQESSQEFKEGNPKQWMFERLDISDVLFRLDRSEIYQLFDSGEVCCPRSHRKDTKITATPVQIERVLSAVALSKGYKKGVQIETGEILGGGRFEYSSHLNMGWFCGIKVYVSGTWAKIVDQDKPEVQPVQKVHELESLPERWAIEVTEYNKVKLDKYFTEKYPENNPYNEIVGSFIKFNGQVYEKKITHITYYLTDEQFDRWVLKKPETTNMVQDTLCKQPETIQTSTPPIMEKQELSTEEKKELYTILQSIDKRKELLNGVFDPTELARIINHCSPIFFTSIDNIPVWEGDEYFQCTDRGNPVKAIALNYYNPVKGVDTASTREACEAHLRDNRMVKVSDVEKMAEKFLFERFQPEVAEKHLVAFIEAFKEELNKLSNEKD